MEIFRQWLATMSTEDLMKMVVQLSATISQLRDKPFCTVRQLDDLQNDLDINRILLKLTFEEIQNGSREITSDDENLLNSLLTQ